MNVMWFVRKSRVLLAEVESGVLLGVVAPNQDADRFETWTPDGRFINAYVSKTAAMKGLLKMFPDAEEKSL